MTNDDIRSAVLAVLKQVAPEIDAARLRPDEPLRDQVDLDSMDFLNFIQRLDEKLGVDVPETAYHEVATLDGCVTYIAAHRAATKS